MTERPELVAACPACRSGKTLRVEGNQWRYPMLFCGACGHMWSGETRTEKKQVGIFDVPLDDPLNH